MAKRNNNSDLKDLQEPVPDKPKTDTKKQTVVFKEMIRADFGAFDEGDSAELPAVLAKQLKDAGIVEFKEKTTPVKNDEEFI